MTIPTQSARPRSVRLQFSLRLLLLAFTAFAIGFPIWYRWPYEETTEEKYPDGTVGTTRIETWQRQWGGGRLLHGPRRLIFPPGDVVATWQFVNGKEHGPFTVRDANGLQKETGQYVDGARDGVWFSETTTVQRTLNSGAWTKTSQTVRRTMNWRHGKLDGPSEIDFGQRKLSLTFANGRLTGMDGRQMQNRLFDLLASGSIDSETIANELTKETNGNLVEMPVKDVLTYFQELHAIPFSIDAKADSKSDSPVTADCTGMDLCSALTIVTSPNGLCCDYRYGAIWVTTPQDANDWRDPTGVADIKPIPGSSLARAWNEPAVAAAINIPLRDVLKQIAAPLAIEIDTSRIEPAQEQASGYTVAANVQGLPFRHVLGHLLYLTGCRCEREGDKLTILPPKRE